MSVSDELHALTGASWMDYFAEFLPNVGILNVYMLINQNAIPSHDAPVTVKVARTGVELICGTQRVTLTLPLIPRSLKFTKPFNLHIKSPATTVAARQASTPRFLSRSSHRPSTTLQHVRPEIGPIRCSFCNELLLDVRGNAYQIRKLPSEHWTELVEAWACHDESYASVATAELLTGVEPSPSTVYIASDHVQCHPSLIVGKVDLSGRCCNCFWTVGYSQTRLFTAPPEDWFCAAILESIEVHNTRTFVLNALADGKRMVLKLVVMNTDTWVRWQNHNYRAENLFDLSERAGSQTRCWKRVLKVAFIDNLTGEDPSGWKPLGEQDIMAAPSSRAWLRIVLRLRQNQSCLPGVQSQIDFPTKTGKTETRLGFLVIKSNDSSGASPFSWAP